MGRQHSYNTGRIRRADTMQNRAHSEEMPRRRAAQYDDWDEEPRRPKKKKRKKWPIVLTVCLVLLGLVGGGAWWLYSYVDAAFDPGEAGVISAEHNTPEEFKGDVFNLLIVGVDLEEGRSYGAEGLGLTDMILYANFVTKDGQLALNLLQIPRDTYVGPIPGSSERINSLMVSGANREHPINNLVECISDQYKLPVDGYVSLDMDGFKAIVDAFNGLYVYVPHRISYDGSTLEPGWRWLNGDTAEFFVRARKGEGYDRSDIDRLDVQRHFYSALFRRFMNMTPADVAKLLPVASYYCNSDISNTQLISLAIKALQLQMENVMFCKVPGATDKSLDPSGQEREFYFVDIYGRGTEEEPGTANLLNQYFRSVGEQVLASELNIPNISIPSHIALYPPNVQIMSSVQEEEGGADINVEHTYD